MPKTYYSLLTREDGRWTIQFGDYDRACVMAERDEYGDGEYRLSDLKIIRSGDTQAEIEAAVAKLNEGGAS